MYKGGGVDGGEAGLLEEAGSGRTLLRDRLHQERRESTDAALQSVDPKQKPRLEAFQRVERTRRERAQSEEEHRKLVKTWRSDRAEEQRIQDIREQKKEEEFDKLFRIQDYVSKMNQRHQTASQEFIARMDIEREEATEKKRIQDIREQKKEEEKDKLFRIQDYVSKMNQRHQTASQEFIARMDIEREKAKEKKRIQDIREQAEESSSLNIFLAARLDEIQQKKQSPGKENQSPIDKLKHNVKVFSEKRRSSDGVSHRVAAYWFFKILMFYFF